MVEIGRTLPETLKEAFYELSMKGPIVKRSELDELVELYPEFSKELTELAATMVIDAITSDELDHPVNVSTGNAIDATSQSVESAIAAFKSRKLELDSTLSSPIAMDNHEQVQTESGDLDSPENPFIPLSRDEFRELATKIQANSTFVSKLRDRLIVPDSIPDSFIEMVASELRIEFRKLKDHLHSSIPVHAPEQFASSFGQELGIENKQSYTEAVNSSVLDDDQKRYLLSFLDGGS